MKATHRQVGQVSVVDISGKITIGEGDVVLRDKVHELWLIAGQDKPKSLGLVESGKAKIIALPADVLGKMAEGSALAISEEAPGGSKNPDGPTGPVISVGKLSKL